MLRACLPQHSHNPTRTNRSSGLIRKSYLLNKQMIIDNSCLALANTQDERFTPFLVIKIKREWLLTFGLGIIILHSVSRRKSLAGESLEEVYIFCHHVFCCVSQNKLSAQWASSNLLLALMTLNPGVNTNYKITKCEFRQNCQHSATLHRCRIQQQVYGAAVNWPKMEALIFLYHPDGGGNANVATFNNSRLLNRATLTNLTVTNQHCWMLPFTKLTWLPYILLWDQSITEANDHNIFHKLLRYSWLIKCRKCRYVNHFYDWWTWMGSAKNSGWPPGASKMQPAINCSWLNCAY
jgi:hypothetical protein